MGGGDKSSRGAPRGDARGEPESGAMGGRGEGPRRTRRDAGAGLGSPARGKDEAGVERPELTAGGGGDWAPVGTPMRGRATPPPPEGAPPKPKADERRGVVMGGGDRGAVGGVDARGVRAGSVAVMVAAARGGAAPRRPLGAHARAAHLITCRTSTLALRQLMHPLRAESPRGGMRICTDQIHLAACRHPHVPRGSCRC